MANPADPWASRQFFVKWARYSYLHCSWDQKATLSQVWCLGGGWVHARWLGAWLGDTWGMQLQDKVPSPCCRPRHSTAPANVHPTAPARCAPFPLLPPLPPPLQLAGFKRITNYIKKVEEQEVGAGAQLTGNR